MPRFIRQILVARIEFDLSNISHYAVLDMTVHHRIFFLFFFLQIQFICWQLVYSYFMISFRMDWLDLLAVQGTLKSLLQHHSSKASTLQCSAFFTVQLSHPYMTTGNIIALARQTFVSKEMSLLFNMLSSLVITFLPGLSVF